MQGQGGLVKPIILHRAPLPGHAPSHRLQLCPQPPLTNVISREELLRIAQEVDPRIVLDESALKSCADIADDFVESVTVFAAELAKHRNAESISVSDIQLHLEQNWGLKLPIPTEAGVAGSVSAEPSLKKAKIDTENSETPAPISQVMPVTAHQQRLLIKMKTLYANKI